MTTDVAPPGSETPAKPRGVPARIAWTLAIVLISYSGWLGAVYLAINVRSCSGEGFQCLGDAIMLIFLGLLAAAVTIWPLLRLARVPAAGLITPAGPALAVLFGYAVAGRAALGEPVTGIALIVLGYLVATLLTEQRFDPRWRAVAAATLLIASVAAGVLR